MLIFEKTLKFLGLDYLFFLELEPFKEQLKFEILPESENKSRLSKLLNESL